MQKRVKGNKRKGKGKEIANDWKSWSKIREFALANLFCRGDRFTGKFFYGRKQFQTKQIFYYQRNLKAEKIFITAQFPNFNA